MENQTDCHIWKVKIEHYYQKTYNFGLFTVSERTVIIMCDNRWVSSVEQKLNWLFGGDRVEILQAEYIGQLTETPISTGDE